MNYLSIDYGEKRIGLALGDSETKMAFPFGVLENKSDDFILEEIQKICVQEKVSQIIVGLPLTMEGERGPQAEQILHFVNFLKINLNMPVVTEDERFSSVMVAKLMAEHKVKERDAVAAMIILQSYLDKKK